MGDIMNTSPNKPDAENPAIASRLAIGRHWRGVSDPERSAEMVPRIEHIE